MLPIKSLRLTLAAATASAETHTDAAEDDEYQNSCSSCY